MYIVIAIVAFLLACCIFVWTRHFWDKPKEMVDMLATYDTIVKFGLTLGEGARLIELRENFIKVGFRNQNGERAIMVKHRSDKEFRVLYASVLNKDYKDLRFNHVYPAGADQNEIVEAFKKEIEQNLEKR